MIASGNRPLAASNESSNAVRVQAPAIPRFRDNDCPSNPAILICCTAKPCRDTIFSGRRGSQMKCSKFVVIAFALALCTRALADLDGAKKALETVKKNIADDNTAGIDSDVKVVELELKDVPDADKKAIQDELDGIKKKLLETKSAKLKPGYTQSIESYI